MKTNEKKRTTNFKSKKNMWRGEEKKQKWKTGKKNNFMVADKGKRLESIQLNVNVTSWEKVFCILILFIYFLPVIHAKQEVLKDRQESLLGQTEK